MNAPLALSKAGPELRLRTALERLLGGSMGGEPRLAAASTTVRPFVHALRVLLLFWVAWAAVEALAWAVDAPSDKQVFSLLAWFGGFSAARAVIARSTTLRLIETIEKDILPYASPRLIEAVAADLKRRNGTARRIVWPLLLALAAGVVGIAAFAHDMKGELATTILSPQAWFAILVMVLGGFVSARSVGAAGFYISFSEQLEEESSDTFFVLGATDSPLVHGLARLGSQVLAFWALIFLAILSSLLLILPWPYDYGLPEASRFVMSFLPLAGFVTLGLGSLVYLRSEAKIRRALRGFTQSQAAVLQQRINALLDPLAGRIPADAVEIDRLTQWHCRILAGGRYGSQVGTAVSIALPLLLPAVSVVWTIYESLVGTAG